MEGIFPSPAEAETEEEMFTMPTIDMVATGRNIMRLREVAGLNVRDLQDIFGFATPQAIYKWQHGTAMPTIDLADQLFVQNKITMKFKGEMVKDGSAYCIVFCKVLKRDVARFEEALERLKDKMLLLGHKDYPAACGEIAKMIEEDTKARMRK